MLGGGGYFFGLGQVGLQLEAVEAEQAVGGPTQLLARVLGDRHQSDLAQPLSLLGQDPAERVGYGDELGLGSASGQGVAHITSMPDSPKSD